MTVHPHLAGCAVLVVVERTMADMTAVLIGDYSLVLLLKYCLLVQCLSKILTFSDDRMLEIGIDVHKG